jgi:hypothetical protein
LQTGIYVLAVIVCGLLLSTRNSFIGEQGNTLFVARMQLGLPYTIYGIFQLIVSAGILFNLLSDTKVGLTSQGRYFLFASIFPVIATAYGVLALAVTPPMPRLIQDGLIFTGVFLFGISVARYQTLVERKTTIQDFPISAFSVLSLAGLYALFAWNFDFSPRAIGYVVVLAVLSHSIYDLAREFLERIRIRYENNFRKQLRELSRQPEPVFINARLQEGLSLLCQTLNAPGGFIALQKEETFFVFASQNSLPIESQIPNNFVVTDDITRLEDGRISNIKWLAPIFEDQKQIGVIGIGGSNVKLEYSTSDLDLLAEVAELMGKTIILSRVQPEKIKQIEILVAEAQLERVAIVTSEEALLHAITEDVGPEFIKKVEDGLRHLTDYVSLGQSELAAQLNLNDPNVIERGKKINQLLTQAIESLRPQGDRPREPLPRLWFNYVVLHDAYVEGVQNREIMARLYISEGTFNRTRRSALRGLARALREPHK